MSLEWFRRIPSVPCSGWWAMRWVVGGLVMVWGLLGSGRAAPLHEVIDRLMAAPRSPSGGAASSARCDDTAFLRRASLALTGKVPTAEAARNFLQDTSAGKRETLLDALLASDAHVEHMTVVLDVMLMERRGEKHVKAAGWEAYLKESMAAHKPWDELVFEVLTADSATESERPRTRFLLEREGEPHAMTRDVGRILFGVDLQCAQCHDHPRIEHYLQRDYHGLFAFFSRSYLFQPVANQPGQLAERAGGEVTFESVFTQRKGRTRPRLPGAQEVMEPVFLPGEEYLVSPDTKDKNVRPVPKYSRRAALAWSLIRTDNRQFAKNMVNRLWRQMMGRALVEPVDFHHPDNPAAHPEVLEYMARWFAENGYDMRALLGQLGRTKVFQRPLELNLATVLDGPLARESKDAAAAAEILYEKVKGDVLSAERAFRESDQRHDEAVTALDPLRENWESCRAALAEARKPFDEARAKRETAKKRVADLRAALPELGQALAHWR